jgi:hypothetical protein
MLRRWGRKALQKNDWKTEDPKNDEQKNGDH